MCLLYKGNQNLIKKDVICLFCSRSVTLSIYYPAFDFLKYIMSQPITIASGWHSPLEKKALKSRESNSQSNIIFYIAKGIDHFKIDNKLSSDYEAGKILIISKWKRGKRIDQNKANERNQLMIERLNKFLFLSINKNGNLESIYKSCLSRNKQVYLLDHPSNSIWMNDKTATVSQYNIEGIV